MNQLEFEANTRDRCQARENACDQVAISFGLASHWLKKLCQPIMSAVKQNQSKREVAWDAELKAALYTEISLSLYYASKKHPVVV